MSADYQFASGKIRALESKMLDHTDIERMVSAPDLETAFKVIYDTDYADNLLEVSPIEYRKALHDDNRQLYDLLKQITPSNDVFALLYLDRDFHNIKALFKAKYHETEVQDIINDNTVYNTEDIKTFIFEGTASDLPENLVAILKELDEKFSENSKPYNIDTEVSRKYFEEKVRLAKNIKNNLIKRLIAVEIDNINITTLLRSIRLKERDINVSKKLLIGGTIDTVDLIKIFDSDIKDLRSIIAVRYDDKVLSAFDSYLDKNNLFELELALENYRIKVMNEAKMIASGPEVIVAYFLAKQNAVSNLRIIMTGKMNKIASEEIKKTLRDSY